MHEFFIKRCIDIAQSGLGNVQPNPMVGCILVYDNQIIGEGYHKNIGEAHAEVNAIASVKDKTLLKKARLYVNLEPCAHYGKTPPCAELITKLKIPEVYIGSIDPYAEVKGKGIEILKKSGCKVNVGILEKQCIELNKRFFTYHQKKRPYIILKWAQTKDGFIDIVRNNSIKKPTWITNEIARTLVHKWRADEQAILVGKHTANIDNPKLNIRNWEGKDPLRIVIDKNLELISELHFFDQSQNTIVFNRVKSNIDNLIEYIKLDFNKDIIPQILDCLYNKGIQSVIIEGGSYLLNSFIRSNIWDEARVFTGDLFFKEGVHAPNIINNPLHTEGVGNSILSIYRNF